MLGQPHDPHKNLAHTNCSLSINVCVFDFHPWPAPKAHKNFGHKMSAVDKYLCLNSRAWPAPRNLWTTKVSPFMVTKTVLHWRIVVALWPVLYLVLKKRIPFLGGRVFVRWPDQEERARWTASACRSRLWERPWWDSSWAWAPPSEWCPLAVQQQNQTCTPVSAPPSADKQINKQANEQQGKATYTSEKGLESTTLEKQKHAKKKKTPSALTTIINNGQDRIGRTGENCHLSIPPSKSFSPINVSFGQCLSSQFIQRTHSVTTPPSPSLYSLAMLHSSRPYFSCHIWQCVHEHACAQIFACERK